MSFSFSYSGSDKCLAIDVMYLNGLVVEAEDILGRAITLPKLDRMQYWFGAHIKPNSREYLDIIAKTATMKSYLEGNTVELISKNVNSGAFANQAEPECRIYLANWFGLKIYSYGERLVTYFHEVSHKADGIRTKDLKYKGADAYKATCKSLADDPSTRASAVTNAENWGYYLVSYAKEAGLMTANRNADWMNVKNKNDIELKTQPTGNDARLTAATEIHLPGKTWKLQSGKREGKQALEDVPCVDLDGNQVYEFVMNYDRLEKKILAKA